MIKAPDRGGKIAGGSGGNEGQGRWRIWPWYACLAMSKTNAARLLDTLGIRYELREYEVDPDDLNAETVARKVGLPPEQVFKTLVARGDRHAPCMAVVPGDAALDLKALARLTGDRKIELVPLKEVQPLTGYIRGGVSALGARKVFPVFADETIELFDVISVSAGVRGTQIFLAPADYLRATGANVGPIAVGKEPRLRVEPSDRGHPSPAAAAVPPLQPQPQPQPRCNQS
jgi:Cys-tRNA(Pro)/Cys-tRNA(Cys) deacylase